MRPLNLYKSFLILWDSNLVLELPEWLVAELAIDDGQHEVGDRRELVELEVEPVRHRRDARVERGRAGVVQSLDGVDPGGKTVKQKVKVVTQEGKSPIVRSRIS